MPLAMGYLKAAALADDRINAGTEITIHNFQGGVKMRQMANQLFTDGPPDILACSVFGWNYRSAGALAETFKQLNPDGWVIFGGTHVSHQGERVFRMFPEVDVVVNDEGEFIFRDVLAAYLDGAARDALGDIRGVSFQVNGQVHTTPARPRIEDLDEIPSPTLTGAIEMTDSAGRFRYDLALIETNRGCPYKCSFCYWGGAVGQKMRSFSRERLRAELELFGKLGVHTIAACDSNFGLLPGDKTFVEDLIEVRSQYGFPRVLESAWAKNKSQTFYDIVRTMKKAGMRSSFTLALQTLDESTLELMNRKNMKVNAWEDLIAWLRKEGLECYAELIWGAPGETVESFMHGYDRLAREVSRIGVYPMLLLPNTDYTAKKTALGLVSVRGDTDDFEYILATNTISFTENQEAQRFLFWARVISENAILRHIWFPLRDLAEITQSQILTDLHTWVHRVDDPAAEPLRTAAREAVGLSMAFADAVTYLLSDPEAKRLLRRWWAESLLPRVPAEVRALLDEVFHYDLLTLPIVHRPDEANPDGDLPVVQVSDENYYLREGVEMAFDVPEIMRSLRTEQRVDLRPTPTTFDIYYKVGANEIVGGTNHEFLMPFMGIQKSEMLARAVAVEKSGVTQ
jgi:tRNA A37 methylthiotransferase MiaB